MPVGTVKVDTVVYDYNHPRGIFLLRRNDPARNLALGLVNPDTGIPPPIMVYKTPMIRFPGNCSIDNV